MRTAKANRSLTPAPRIVAVELFVVHDGDRPLKITTSEAEAHGWMRTHNSSAHATPATVERMTADLNWHAFLEQRRSG